MGLDSGHVNDALGDVLDYLSRIVDETYVALYGLHRVCGEVLPSTLRVLALLAKAQLQLCGELEDYRDKLLCLDIVESHNAIILLIARGAIAHAAMITRRALEETASLLGNHSAKTLEYGRTWYHRIAGIIIDKLKVCHQDINPKQVEEAVKILSRSFRENLQGFLSRFVHALGSKDKVIMYINLFKPPIVETDPQHLCEALEVALQVITFSLVLIHTAEAASKPGKRYLEQLNTIINEIKRETIIEKNILLKETVDMLSALIQCLTNKINSK